MHNHVIETDAGDTHVGNAARAGDHQCRLGINAEFAQHGDGEGEHIGIVQSVDPDGSIHTIEGNSSDKVSQRTYGADGGGATGYVRLG